MYLYEVYGTVYDGDNEYPYNDELYAWNDDEAKEKAIGGACLYTDCMKEDVNYPEIEGFARSIRIEYIGRKEN